jgi:hypothetical protein
MTLKQLLEELVVTSVAKKGTGYVDFEMAIAHAHSEIMKCVMSEEEIEKVIKETPFVTYGLEENIFDNSKVLMGEPVRNIAQAIHTLIMERLGGER